MVFCSVRTQVKIPVVVLAAKLLTALTLYAQLVNDGATNTLSNTTNSFTGDVTVGTNGSFTLLTLSNNMLLTNTVNGIIGRNLTAKSNEVRLVSSTARWRMGGTLFVGSNGIASRLVVSNGAFAEDASASFGFRLESSNNAAVITDPGSLWSNRFGLNIGGLGRANQMVVSNGGWVVSRSALLGVDASSSNNFVLVSGAGSVWSNATSLSVGSIAPGNRLVIEGGGLVDCDSGVVGDFNSASNNEALVTGPGSLWINHSGLTIGSQMPFNRLVVSNGAAVRSGGGTLGPSNNLVVTGSGSIWTNATTLYLLGRADVAGGGWLACNDGYVAGTSNAVILSGASGWNNLGTLRVGDFVNGTTLIASNGATVLSSNALIGSSTSLGNNNLVLLTGGGTVWNNGADFTVGNFGIGNRLAISNGATVTASNLFVGFQPSSGSNRVIVDGGALRVTNVTGNGALDVRRGTNALNAGLIEVDQLLLTNSAGGFEFNAGTLSVKRATTSNGQLFRVGTGLSPATLNLTANGPFTFANGLTISATAALTGMAISKNAGAPTNTQIQVTGALTYGGSLTVTNPGATALAAGDRFQLFTASSFAGSISTLSLPPLSFGLQWVTNLLVDGSIEVESLAPTASTLPATVLSQVAATLNGVVNPKGADTIGWFEFGFSTNYGNVSPPQPLGNANSTTNFSQVVSNLIPVAVYHFRAVASNSFGIVFGADEAFPSLAQIAYLKASNSGANDQFGTTVSIDGNTVVVGAPFEASNASGVNGNQNDNSRVSSGAAYVFVRNGGSWIQQAYLKAGNTDSGDRFGSAVAVSGDTVVVGAPFEDSNATGVNGDSSNNVSTDSGAAYVFLRSGTNWTQQAYLKASNTGGQDLFGATVAISGDTILVGASGEASNATGVNGNQNNNSIGNSGAAYVFVRSGTNWTQQAYLKSANPTVNGAINGVALGISGDTAVLGFSDDVCNGAAYVFVRNGTTWGLQASLQQSDPDCVDIFGVSVAVDGDTVVVGAAFEDSNSTGVNGDGSNDLAVDSGAAYVFVRSGTNWSRQAYLKASNTGANDRFGVSVALQGNTAVVGAYLEDSSGVDGDGANNASTNSGAAYVFTRIGTNWSFQHFLKASNTDSQDFFGWSVAASGDTVVVGAYAESSSSTGVNGDPSNSGAPSSGAAYVFGPPLPPFGEIAVFQSNTNIPNGGTSAQYLVAGTNTETHNFTIRNFGNDFLTGLDITINGPDATGFGVISNPVAPVFPAGSTQFSVRFSPTHTGTNTATMHIASNDLDENPFDIVLNGLSLSFTEDHDGDGLNDASEFLLAPLGFDFQVAQPSLVSTLFSNLGGAVSNLNAAGFFSQSQLQALKVDSPLLTRDPNTALFKLTIGVEKATQLTNFFPFPMSAPQISINPEGKLEFQFGSTDNAAFFRLQSH